MDLATAQTLIAGIVSLAIIAYGVYLQLKTNSYTKRNAEATEKIVKMLEKVG